MKGCLNKNRFTINVNGEIRRFGTCDPRDTDAMEIVKEGDKYYLVNRGHDGNSTEVSREELPEITVVTHGFYDHEHTQWLTLKEFKHI